MYIYIYIFVIELLKKKYSMTHVKRGKAEFIQYHCNTIGDIAMGFYSGRGRLGSTPNTAQASGNL